jgi:hypothetical protein
MTEDQKIILSQFADMEKRLGETSIAVMAQHLVLCDLFPDFESRYLSQMASARVLGLKREFEHRISALLEKLHEK